MAGKYEHSFRVHSGRLPVFGTQNQAYDFLADYQARGAIRRCVHARVRPTGTGGWSGFWDWSLPSDRLAA